MMNILHKMFGHKPTITKQTQRTASVETLPTIQDNAEKLWKCIEEIITFYNDISCQCAFPRYRQIISLDCVEYGKSFYSSETQGFIQLSRPYFDITEGYNKEEDNSQIWTCKKCGSTYDYAYSGFSIYVNRGYLKIKEHKSPDIGAPTQSKIPFYVGLFGHSYPERALFKEVDLGTFRSYMLETITGY
ncbi:hypothetical protein KJS94_02835 [Flavihumibacter rivuli]|uniref:hypothetical protein n=1 Tax=Flavihumibacter rivuli TaxID=2838156 RepID=UPI001BDDECCC|nr:hypothetical protein [Flavihumibacter rivuli]ULQ57132.1 hypothetical protein KJS94_02835 [Flavihumibacter rivuli]